MSSLELGAFTRSPERTGVFLDFDGTLSAIVHVPSEARPVEGAPDMLARLAARYRVVAVVSGRSAEQLSEWLGPDVEIWGVHGAQRARGGRIELSERVAPYTDLMAKVVDEARLAVEDLGIEGVLVEDKGVMVGLHFRAARDVEEARAALDRLAERLVAEHGLWRAGGRLAFELRAPVELSKQRVLLDRVRDEELRAAIFVGDDTVDIPAFDALDELAEEGVATLRVGVDSDEAPPELKERADLMVDGPPGVLSFLAELDSDTP